MKDIVKLSREEVEDAIIEYIGHRRGQSFFPYMIVNVWDKYTLSNEITFEIEMIAKGAKISERKVVI